MRKLLIIFALYLITTPTITVPVRVYRVNNVALSNTQIETIIANASRTWNTQSQISLQLISIEDITINIESIQHANYVLNQADHRSFDAVDIYFMGEMDASGLVLPTEANKVFVNTNDQYFPIEQIIAHEIGHIFGLEHQAIGLMSSDENTTLTQTETEQARESALELLELLQ